MKTYRAGKSGYVVLGVVVGVFIAAFCPRWLNGRIGIEFPVLWGALALGVGWLYRFRIDVSDKSVRYTTLLSQRTIPFENIQTVSREFGVRVNQPTVRIVIRPKDDSDELSINAKVMNLPDINDFLDAMASHEGVEVKKGSHG